MIAWIDIETTGLTLKSCIVEFAMVITDDKYNVKCKYDSIVNPLKDCEWQDGARDMHVKSGLWANLWSMSAKTIQKVDITAADLLKRYQVDNKPYILAGSSVHFDRGFVEKYMPFTSQKLHYRNLDVSSIKIFVSNKTGIPTEDLPPLKSNTKHRALDDIEASLEAIRWYSYSCLDPSIYVVKDEIL